MKSSPKILICLFLAAAAVGHCLAGDDAPNAENQISAVPIQQISTATDASNGEALPTDDNDTLTCNLNEGRSTFVVKLRETALLDRFTFVNENALAAGELKIAVSNYQLPATSTKWMDVDGTITFSHKRLFKLSMVGVEARYIRLSFDVTRAGRIAALGVFGTSSAAASGENNADTRQVALIGHGNRQPRSAGGFDWATKRADARVVYVSSNPGPATARMIDERADTAFRFASSDISPTVVVELAETERLNRVTARYKMHSVGRLDVFLLNNLPPPPPNLRHEVPVASTGKQNAAGEAVVNFDPAGARYVALRFTPDDPANVTDGVEVAEIHAYGDTPQAIIEAMEAPSVYAKLDPGTIFPGETGPEISNTLGTLAVPPVIPDVSAP